MISVEKEQQIRLLLKDGLSIRKIAKKVEVARGTVTAIKKLSEMRKRNSFQDGIKKLKKPRRCKTCGGMMKLWPCLWCHPEAGDYDKK